LIKPQTIGVINDDDEHFISIKRNASSGYLFSKEPKKIEEIINGKSVQQILSRKLDMDNNLEEEVTFYINRMREIISNSLRDNTPNIGNLMSNELNESKFDLLTNLSRFYFDSEVIFLVKN